MPTDADRVLSPAVDACRHEGVQGRVRLRELSVALLIWVSCCMPQPAPTPLRQASGAQPVPPAGISEEAPESLEVWIRGEDAKWIARAEGQLSDLPVRIHLLSQPLELDFEQQLAAGKAVRTEGLVVWLLPDARAAGQLSSQGDGAYFFAWFASARRLYVRRVGPASDESDASEWSATLEIAALALRTAVRAALAGQALGVEAERPTVPAPPTTTGAQPTRHVRANQEGPLRWLVAASATWTLDGETDAGLLSIGPQVGAELRLWRLSVFGEVGLPSTIQSYDAKLALRRSYLVATLGRVFAPSNAVHLTPQLYCGAAWFRRDTESRSERLLASQSNTTASGVIGLGLLAELAVTHHVLLGAELGGVWVPGAPKIQLLREDETVLASHPLWSVQPQLRLGLGAGW
jgi:hypothetical protein